MLLSLRRADTRFLLPWPPHNAVVFGDLEGWREGLARGGIVAGDPTSKRAPDLAVGPVAAASEAIASAAGAVLLEGGRLPHSVRGNFVSRSFLPLPDPTAAELLLPLEQPLALRYALRNWTVPLQRWKWLRNRALATTVGRAAAPFVRPVVWLLTRSAEPPFLVRAAAQSVELGPAPSWFLTLGEGDALTRGVLHLFASGSAVPGWVLKFGRVPDYAQPFAADERSLALVARAGGSLAARAPRFLGRLEAGGLPASLETAATGRRLTGVLREPSPPARKRAAVDAVAGWLVHVARETAGPPGRLEPERRRMRERVIPTWSELGATPRLVEALLPVPAVFEHRDLGTWNLISDGVEFTAVDWESAEPAGFPLWDLIYFLADALAHIDGSSGLDERAEHARLLFTGRLGSSGVLFAWVRRMVEAIELESDAVGPLATLCWLHHGRSLRHRDAAAERHGAAAPGAGAGRHLEAIATTWMSDPQLGGGWTAWR